MKKPALLMACIVVVTISCWEIYLRSIGVDNSYDDGPPLWSAIRDEVYQDTSKAVVFIGSSRIKYDLDIATWKSLTGKNAVQLSCVGSSPIPLLVDLANDENFSGNLVIDVTEVLFFSGAPHFAETPNKAIKYYEDRSPAQRASFLINKPLEATFCFLDKSNFSTNSMLDKLPISNREGVDAGPLFPMQFERTNIERQSYMTEEFVADTNLQNRVKSIWDKLGKRAQGGTPQSAGALDTILTNVKSSIDKIKARGGEVIFVRTPSSGRMFIGESMGFPKTKYWDRLLAETGCKGIYFLEHESLSHFICAENSHLSQPDAIKFTKALIPILETETGWNLHKNSN
ncbi:MAG: hypothetical protein ABIV51_05670 [Saprospiraceae bacterium]